MSRSSGTTRAAAQTLTTTATSAEPRRFHRRPSARAWARSLAAVGVIAVGCSAAALTLMQVLPPGEWLDPLSTPLSNYALTGVGWWFDAALLLLLVGVLALWGALVLGRLTRIGSLASVFLALCALGLVTMVVFPDYADAAGQLTTTGWLHTAGSVLAFSGPPLACLALARRHQRADGCSRLPGLTGWLGAFTLGWFAVLVTVTALGWALGSSTQPTVTWQWTGAAGTGMAAWQHYPYGHLSSYGSDLGGDYGLIERGLTVAELVVALVLIVWAWRGCRCRASRSVGQDNAPQRRP